MPKITHRSIENRKMRGQRDSPNDTIRERWKVTTNERVSWSWLKRQSTIPLFDAEHYDERGFYVHSIDPEWTKPLLWTIDYTWSPFQIERIDPSPTARPAEIDVASQIIEAETLWDRRNNPIVNTAGEFVTGVTSKRLIYEYRITKNLSRDPDWLDSHGAALNSDTVRLRGRTCKPKTLFLNSIALSPYSTENKQRHTTLSMSLLYDPLGWTKEVWNQGTVQLVRTRQPFWTKDGTKSHKTVWTQIPIQAGKPLRNVTKAVPLNSTGQAVIDLIDPNSNETIDPARIIVLDFETQQHRAFNGTLPLT